MATYTHTGNRAAVGYQHTGRDFNHYEKSRGKVHALNARGYRMYAALCGVVVREESSDCHDQGGSNPIELATAGVRVTCRACLRQKPVAVGVPKKARHVVFLAACTGEVVRWSTEATREIAERYAASIAARGTASVTQPAGYVLNAWVETRVE